MRGGVDNDRTAVIVKARLSHIQLAKPLGNDEIRFFDDPEKALEWLLAPVSKAASTPAASPEAGIYSTHVSRLTR